MKAICDNCFVEFELPPCRFKKGKHNFCTYECNADFRTAKYWWDGVQTYITLAEIFKCNPDTMRVRIKRMGYERAMMRIRQRPKARKQSKARKQYIPKLTRPQIQLHWIPGAPLTDSFFIGG